MKAKKQQEVSAYRIARDAYFNIDDKTIFIEGNLNQSQKIRDSLNHCKRRWPGKLFTTRLSSKGITIYPQLDVKSILIELMSIIETKTEIFDKEAIIKLNKLREYVNKKKNCIRSQQTDTDKLNDLHD